MEDDKILIEEQLLNRRSSRKKVKENEITTKKLRNKNRESKKKKHKKHYRPCSPAAYPSPIPIPVIYDNNNNNNNINYHSLLEEEEEEVENETSSISSQEEGDDKHNNDTRIIGSPSDTDDTIIYNRSHRNKNNNNHTIRKNQNNKELENKKDDMEKSFFAFRIHYLIIHIAIMLADGLQGTHLYVLYESYGYTVASLYCLGFVSGAITSPFIGPLVDKVGRRNSAIAYCVLEIGINMLEQYDILTGLIISRVVGGITTNLLFTVFESWLVTEHRKRGFEEEKLEIVLRDSVVASNLSAIASGCLSHILALYLGMSGPFEGAVVCTFVALMLVCTRWEENYGYSTSNNDSGGEDVQTVRSYMIKACSIIASDSKIFRIGLIQGLTEGALQTFVFLWSPAMRHLASSVVIDNNSSTWNFYSIGMDNNGEPAYGLIFGAFMLCGALGGMSESYIRKKIANLLLMNATTNKNKVEQSNNNNQQEEQFTENMSDVSGLTLIDDGSFLSTEEEEYDNDDDNDDDDDDNPLAANILTFICYVLCAMLLSVPIIVNQTSSYSFTITLIAFLCYEFLVGLYLPCEGVLRTYFMPNDSICSLMTTLRVIVNVAVALGVISTNYIPFNIAFAACSGALILSAILQLTLIDTPSLPWINNSNNSSATTMKVKLVNSEKVDKSNNTEISSSFSSNKRPDLVNADSSLFTLDSTIVTSSDNDDMYNINKVDDNSRSINKIILNDNNGLRQRKVNISSS